MSFDRREWRCLSRWPGHSARWIASVGGRRCRVRRSVRRHWPSSRPARRLGRGTARSRGRARSCGRPLDLRSAGHHQPPSPPATSAASSGAPTPSRPHPCSDDALAAGAISAAHVDRLGETLRRLTAQRADAARSRDETRLLLAATNATANEFARILRREEARLRRPVTATTGSTQQTGRRPRSRRTPTTTPGMVALPARRRPAQRRRLDRRSRPRRGPVPRATLPGCPTDPLERQAFLRAHALLPLIGGDARRRPPAGAEIIVVVDHTAPDGTPDIDWGRPVDIPERVLDDLLGRRPRCTRWSCATASSSPHRADSTSAAPPAWPTEPNGGHSGRCTAAVQYRAATPPSTSAPSTTSAGGDMAAPPTCRICCRCAIGTTTSSTTSGWTAAPRTEPRTHRHHAIGAGHEHRPTTAMGGLTAARSAP